MVEEKYKALEACLEHNPSFQIRHKGNTLCALSELIKPAEKIACPYINEKRKEYKDDRSLAICERPFDGWLRRLIKKFYNKSYSQTKKSSKI